jgi:hypothetical protein
VASPRNGNHNKTHEATWPHYTPIFFNKVQGLLKNKNNSELCNVLHAPIYKSLVQVFSKSLKMHQVVMQLMNSHLKKNLKDDNKSGASQLVVIFSI